MNGEDGKFYQIIRKSFSSTDIEYYRTYWKEYFKYCVVLKTKFFMLHPLARQKDYSEQTLLIANYIDHVYDVDGL